MSHFGNIGHHLIVAIIDIYRPYNGWVMWKMGTWLMTHAIGNSWCFCCSLASPSFRTYIRSSCVRTSGWGTWLWWWGTVTTVTHLWPPKIPWVSHDFRDIFRWILRRIWGISASTCKRKNQRWYGRMLSWRTHRMWFQPVPVNLQNKFLWRNLKKSIAGWWFFANPSEKWWTSSVGMIIPYYSIPNCFWKVIYQIPWFQSPPTSILSNGFIPYIEWIYPLYESRFYTMGYFSPPTSSSSPAGWFSADWWTTTILGKL